MYANPDVALLRPAEISWPHCTVREKGQPVGRKRAAQEFMTSGSASITRLLREWRDGDDQAMDRLVPLVYDHLRRLAGSELKRRPVGHSLQPTELVHDAYERLLGLDLSWQDRVHFYRMVARTLRRVLVDHARARQARKRGGDVVRVELSEIHGERLAPATDVLDLHEALEGLGAMEPRLAKVVELCYFGGLTYREVGHTLSISPATVDRDLRFARAWLRRELALGDTDDTLRQDS